MCILVVAHTGGTHFNSFFPSLMTSGVVYLYEFVIISHILAIALTGLVATQHSQFTCLLFLEVKCTRAVSKWCKVWSEYVSLH